MMTPQQQADEMARKCALAIPPDVLEHPMPFPARLDYAQKQILRTIPLVQLLECVEALRSSGKQLQNIVDYGALIHFSDASKVHAELIELNKALTNLDRAMKGEKV